MILLKMMILNKPPLDHGRQVYIFLVIIIMNTNDDNNNSNKNDNMNNNNDSNYKQNSSLSWQACVHLPGDHWSGDFLRHRGGARGLHVLQEAIIKYEKEKRYKKN